jgi:hypothetical protein
MKTSEMKLSKLVLAVASTLVVSQAFAAPVTPANVLAARNAGTLKETWISGASAPSFNVFDAFARGCDANSLAIFSNATTVGRPGSIGDYNAFACTRNSGTVTVLYSTTAGGSFNAYAPHLPSTAGTAPDGSAYPAYLQRVADVANQGTCVQDTFIPSTSAPIDYIGTSGIPFYKSCNRGFASASAANSTTNVTTTNSTTSATTVTTTTFTFLNDSAPSLPAGGFSDVEAQLWEVDPSPYGVESALGVQQAFGIGVTTNLYRALQTAQGISAEDIAADTGFSHTKAPNITSAEYASIVKDLGGYRANWSKLLGSAVGANKNVNLARRTGTSGTQAASNAFFLQNPLEERDFCL